MGLLLAGRNVDQTTRQGFLRHYSSPGASRIRTLSAPSSVMTQR